MLLRRGRKSIMRLISQTEQVVGENGRSPMASRSLLRPLPHRLPCVEKPALPNPNHLIALMPALLSLVSVTETATPSSQTTAPLGAPPQIAPVFQLYESHTTILIVVWLMASSMGLVSLIRRTTQNILSHRMNREVSEGTGNNSSEPIVEVQGILTIFAFYSYQLIFGIRSLRQWRIG